MSGFFRNIANKALRKALYRFAPFEVMVALRYLRSKNGKVFPKRNIFVTDMLPIESVLILSPHPDDETIGMGGTLAMYLANGSKVTVLYMTGGGGLGESRQEMIRIRRKEAQALGRACGMDQIFWDKEDTRLSNDRETVADMVRVLENVRPSAVYLPSYFDHHYDHFAANKILMDALNERSSMQVTICGYEVWTTIPFQNYVVDISGHFERKKELLKHYITPLGATDFIKLVKCRGAVHYMLYIDSGLEKARDGYAEAFCRFDSETYQHLFADYVELLKEHRSPMLAHLHTGASG